MIGLESRERAGSLKKSTTTEALVDENESDAMIYCNRMSICVVNALDLPDADQLSQGYSNCFESICDNGLDLGRI